MVETKKRSVFGLVDQRFEGPELLEDAVHLALVERHVMYPRPEPADRMLGGRVVGHQGAELLLSLACRPARRVLPRGCLSELLSQLLVLVGQVLQVLERLRLVVWIQATPP